MGKQVTLVLRRDYKFGGGRSLPPGTVIARVEFADGCPAALATPAFLGSGLSHAFLMAADTLGDVAKPPSEHAPTGPMERIVTEAEAPKPKPKPKPKPVKKKRKAHIEQVDEVPEVEAGIEIVEPSEVIEDE